MTYVRLVEPLGLVYGNIAQAAIKQGDALPLCGGPVAFTYVRLIEGYQTIGLMPVQKVPQEWALELERITRSVPSVGLPAGLQIMGILNITPDSFSDGGKLASADEAILKAHEMVRAGATVLDIGGESTRPGSATVTPVEEWKRIGPVLVALKAELPSVAVSVDTRNSYVMQQALAAGAHIINDVTALVHDAAALPLLAVQDCGVVLMHMRGTPQTMAEHAVYEDVSIDVVRELAQRIEVAVKGGIARHRIMVDPGFGFAKNFEQNKQLLRHILLLTNLGCRVVFGVSRKRMIGNLTGETTPHLRDAGTQAASFPAMALGSTVLRVHDVKGMMQAVNVWREIYQS
ncbi:MULTISPECIES: dihydropteroate synthase [Acetobacter]|uniref:Dihydropteroate synthase n=3 Tax=Acetobacter TaxID=434 RepID=F1YRR5_9PROT|nr:MULTISPECIES: dihydropteroate synthase [Acetobacter]ASL41457.1 dihydropteroate synthase [Acetobacter oryzifermentans]ATI12351.1 dihydropteroate synthase [Acetobacter pomorum]AXC27511.1 dihydropteroate synthase [Acetobacter sp. JWB]AXM99220.1 dihydropteroate synthase [Acetobacter pomorum]EGE48505.1 Dihydropteroate synthase [Acetobacter pomorum DM001]